MGDTSSDAYDSMVNGQSLIRNSLQFVLIGLHNVRKLNSW